MINTDFKIVADEQHFILINKAENSNFHDEDELGSGIFNTVKSSLNIEQLYPVHRLDKMTSGLLLFAKTSEAAAEFGRLFEQHQVEKYYLAISKNKPKKKQGTIKGDMQKSRRSAWKLLRTANNPAISQFFSYGLGDGTRLFMVRPLSGKTHQIRVALNSIGSAIAGDTIYNPSDISDRGYLHALAIRFTLFGQQYQFIQAPNSGEYFLTEQCQKALDSLPPAWDLAWPK